MSPLPCQHLCLVPPSPTSFQLLPGLLLPFFLLLLLLLPPLL